MVMSMLVAITIALVTTLPLPTTTATVTATDTATDTAIATVTGTARHEQALHHTRSLGGTEDDIIMAPLDVKYKTLGASFENTLRNCLGKHCFDQKPDGSSFETVGLLAPPASAGEDILNAIVKSGVSIVSSSVHLEYDSHVPAYGYGKNHGWSRIVRLVRYIFV